MNWESKVYFLTLVRDNRYKLFSHLNNQLNDAAKEENWRKIFEQCVAYGCNGLRSVDFLRKTTWQNLRRRFEHKFEKSATDPTVEFDQLDELIREALGRGNEKLDRSIFEQFSLENLSDIQNHSPNSIFAPHLDLNASSSEESSQITTNDIHDKKDELLLSLESLTKQINQKQEEDQQLQNGQNDLEVDTSPPTLRVAPIPTPTPAFSNASSLKRRRLSHVIFDKMNGITPLEKMDLNQLEREKLIAQIKWLEADTELKQVQKRNAELETEMKQLQYLKLQKESLTEMGLM
ncbi:unnamed protein product [Bursaphelenchus xylophilus]|uniref:Regulatory protein zeste n=1 Tax=Bursaphelenchus xylophilus TaxID=6326 RepID=A0A1I7S6Y0_BURXY|nr:unnamed protein product [Bursaphelenchus xylophilus]CAG9079616.1 unnamed protein product [Bursaphelenchus xylophilus]